MAGRGDQEKPTRADQGPRDKLANQGKTRSQPSKQHTLEQRQSTPAVDLQAMVCDLVANELASHGARCAKASVQLVSQFLT